VELDFNELRELLTVLHQTDISELTLKNSEFELTVRKEIRGGDRLLATTISAPDMVLPSITSASSPSLPSPSIAPSATGSDGAAPVAPPGAERLVDIMSPMVGTFYRAPGPDDSPYVEVSDRIRVGQAVCIIEAMKLMNEIEAEVSGEIVEILVQNGEPVEYGQPLMRVNPG
jgi:acetyl-CoA carboxylase biotin carboxyl carrier protein